MAARFIVPKSRRNPLASLGVAILSVAAVTLLRFPLQHVLGTGVPFLLYFPAVLFSAWYGGLRPGLIAALLGAVASSFFWMEPAFAFAPLTSHTVAQLTLFLLVCGFMTWLVDLLHKSIEQLHEAESRIRRQAERFQVTLASIGDALLATDHTGNVQFMNSVAEQLTGWSAADALGRPLSNVFKIISQLDRKPITDPVQTVLAEKRVVGLANHTVLVAKDGTERVIEDSAAPIWDQGQILGVVLVFHDVTERDRNRRKLTELHRRLEQVLGSMNDGFMLFDRDWRYTYVNDSGARIAQKPKQELIGRNVWDLFPDEVGQPGYEQLAKAMREQVPIHFEYFYPRFQRWFEYKAYPADEGLALYVADITEQKNVQLAVTTQLEQRVAQKTAELQSRNQSLEALTHSLAHDLRAPMRSVGSFAAMLLEDHASVLPLDGQQLATRIISSAKHAEKLMNDLLEFGRLAHAELPVTSVDSHAVAESVLQRLNGDITAQRASISIPQRLPPVLANTVVLEQALTNLIVNALKYTNDGEPPQVTLLAEKHGPFVRIIVQDHGAGIAPQYIHKLFKPFTRLTSAKPGSGLGLSIVAKGIERLGGHVGVESQPGNGSRFWFELPAS